MLPPKFQRETIEFCPVSVTVNGTAVTANVTFNGKLIVPTGNVNWGQTNASRVPGVSLL